MRPRAIAAVLVAGCFAPARPPATVESLCANPDLYDGASVSIPAVVVGLTACTAIGCMWIGTTGCCNACWTTYAMACPDDGSHPAGRFIELTADPSAGFPVVQGVPSTPNDDGLYVLQLIGTTTDFGCVGQDCAPVCTPAPAANIVAVEGTFHATCTGCRSASDPQISVASVSLGP